MNNFAKNSIVKRKIVVLKCIQIQCFTVSHEKLQVCLTFRLSRHSIIHFTDHFDCSLSKKLRSTEATGWFVGKFITKYFENIIVKVYASLISTKYHPIDKQMRHIIMISQSKFKFFTHLHMEQRMGFVKNILYLHNFINSAL